MKIVALRQQSARMKGVRLALLVGLALAVGLAHTYLSLLSHGHIWLAHPVRAFSWELSPRQDGPLGSHHVLLEPPLAERLPEAFNDLKRPVKMKVEFQLAPDGTVNGQDIVDSSGAADLDRQTLRAVGEWRFGALPPEAPRQVGERVTVEITNRYRVDLGWQGVGLGWLLFSGLLLLTTLLLPRGGGTAASLLPAAGLLAGMGWLLIWRLAPDLEQFALPTKQAIFMAGSLFLTVLVAQVTARWRGMEAFLQRTGAFWVGAGVLLLVITALFGLESGTGHRLWLPTPIGPIQTVEVVKVILVLYAAAFFSSRAREGRATVLARYGSWLDRYQGVLGSFALVLATLVLMKDFGPFLLLILVLLTGLYLQGERRAAGIFTLLLGLVLLASYAAGWPGRWRERVDIWRNPWQAVAQEGDAGRPALQRGREHLAQVIWAVSSGGLWGRGLGQGIPHNIEAVESDFNFAALSEELGFAGAGVTLLLFLLLVWAGSEVAAQHEAPFERHLVAGVAALFGWQTMLTVGGNLALTPLTGLTLPFISYGGSSLVMNFLALGLLLGIAGRAPRGPATGEDAPLSPDQRRLTSVGLRQLQAVFALLFLILLGKLGWLQWPGHRARYVQVGHQRADGTTLSNPRLDGHGEFVPQYVTPGKFLDRRGTVLAETTPQGRRYFHAWRFGHLVGFESPRRERVGLTRSLWPLLTGRWTPPLLHRITRTLRVDQAGFNVVLTLDQRLQDLAYEEMAGKKGSLVALDPATGEVLAAANRPALDPNQMDVQGWIAAYDARPDALPFCYRRLYPPGSAFKTLVAAAALETKTVSPSETITCTGSYRPGNRGPAIRDYGGGAHGAVTLHQALVPSCNNVYAKAGVKLGWEKLFDFADGAGFNRYLSLIPRDLEEGEEAPLQVNQSELWPGGRWAEEIPAEWKQPDVLGRIALGQYNVRTTPLYLALWAAAIANQGAMMQPSVIKAVTDDQGNELWRLQPQVMLEPMSPATAKQVTAMMVDVVERGTARRAKVPGLNIAGKTGTPEEDAQRTHAVFIAFAPADKPSLAVAVVIEERGGGGRVAAPIVGRFLQKALALRAD